MPKVKGLTKLDYGLQNQDWIKLNSNDSTPKEKPLMRFLAGLRRRAFRKSVRLGKARIDKHFE